MGPPSPARTCCASSRRRSSPRSSGATASSTRARTRSRRRSSPRRNGGRRTASPTTRRPGSSPSRPGASWTRGGARAPSAAARRRSSRWRRGDLPQPVDQDDTLTLLFLCCHPALSVPSQMALTLRAVGGLRTGEIANAFLVPEATMAQRISRAKQRIRETGGRFDLPPEAERAERLRSGPARALPRLQRGLHDERRRDAAPRRPHRRGDPADATPAATPARRGRGGRPARPDAADRRAPGRAHDRGRLDRPARGAAARPVGPIADRRGHGADRADARHRHRSARISCRPRSRPCTTRRRAPERRTGRRSWRCTRCSRRCRRAPWSR